jgi:Two component regulator propeller
MMPLVAAARAVDRPTTDFSAHNDVSRRAAGTLSLERLPAPVRRRPEVVELDSKRVISTAALSLVVAVLACNDTVVVPPPPKPPQIATTKQYYKATNGKGQPVGLPSDNVFAFLVVSNGQFWVGTDAGIAVYPDENAATRINYYNEINGLPNPDVRAMVEYNGNVYVGTWGGGFGIYDLTAGTWKTVRAKSGGLRNNFISDIAPIASEDRVYFATASGVSIYNPVAGTFTSFIPPQLADRIVSSIETFNDGSTQYRWYGPKNETKITPDSLQYHGITVSRTPGTVIKYTTVNSALPEPDVNDIFYDSVRGTFWIALATQGVAEVDVPNKTWTHTTTVDGLPSNTVYSITRAGTTVWAATQNGVAKLLANGRWQGYNRSGGLQADRVQKLYSPDGDKLYLGFVNGGAARVKTN